MQTISSGSTSTAPRPAGMIRAQATWHPGGRSWTCTLSSVGSAHAASLTPPAVPRSKATSPMPQRLCTPARTNHTCTPAQSSPGWALTACAALPGKPYSRGSAHCAAVVSSEVCARPELGCAVCNASSNASCANGAALQQPRTMCPRPPSAAVQGQTASAGSDAKLPRAACAGSLAGAGAC